MVQVNVSGGTLQQDEINAYIAHGKKQAPDKLLTAVDIKLDGEWADISYHYTNPLSRGNFGQVQQRQARGRARPRQAFSRLRVKPPERRKTGKKFAAREGGVLTFFIFKPNNLYRRSWCPRCIAWAWRRRARHRPRDSRAARRRLYPPFRSS